MKKVQAGGIIRTSLDNTWQTPESILEPVRAYFGGQIPFDPASAPNNPTRAARFCCGPPGRLFSSPGPTSATAPALFGELPEPEIPGERLEVNGLELAWDWPFFCNPPYGEDLSAWIAKTASEAERLPGRAGITLWPASRWETSYLPPALARAAVVCFHRGRVAFVSSADGQAVSGNPGASMVLGWNVDVPRFAKAFGPLGRCFRLSEVLGG